MKKKILYICIICILVVLCVTAGFFIYNNSTSGKHYVYQKCPDEYGVDDAGSAEYLAATNKWTNDFFDTHPGATLSEWSKARYQFWVDNNCEGALQRYKDVKDGNADPVAVERINDVIQGAINNPKYYSELGFLFNYPKDMFVIDGSDGPDDNYRLLIIPNSYRDNENQDLTAIVISASLNNPTQTPLEWLKGSDSGADMTKGYSKININGQEAISMNKGSWITVDTPDNKYQISIATLPGDNPSQLLQDEMSSIVKSIVFNK